MVQYSEYTRPTRRSTRAAASNQVQRQVSTEIKSPPLYALASTEMEIFQERRKLAIRAGVLAEGDARLLRAEARPIDPD